MIGAILMASGRVPKTVTMRMNYLPAAGARSASAMRLDRIDQSYGSTKRSQSDCQASELAFTNASAHVAAFGSARSTFGQASRFHVSSGLETTSFRQAEYSTTLIWNAKSVPVVMPWARTPTSRALKYVAISEGETPPAAITSFSRFASSKDCQQWAGPTTRSLAFGRRLRAARNALTTRSTPVKGP